MKQDFIMMVINHRGTPDSLSEKVEVMLEGMKTGEVYRYSLQLIDLARTATGQARINAMDVLMARLYPIPFVKGFLIHHIYQEQDSRLVCSVLSCLVDDGIQGDSLCLEAFKVFGAQGEERMQQCYVAIRAILDFYKTVHPERLEFVLGAMIRHGLMEEVEEVPPGAEAVELNTPTDGGEVLQ